MTAPVISIVIPTFNRGYLIKETLKNVLVQSYENFEIIIIDNASTDNTEEIISEFLFDKRVTFIKSPVNKERSYSRNIGMEKAKGDFVTFLDSDDFMYQDALLDAINFIKENPSILFFHNKYEFVNNLKERVYLPSYPSLKNQYKAISSGNFISCIGVYLHKSIYKKIKFSLDPKMISAEDYEIWFSILAKHKLGRIDKINFGIREHEDRTLNLVGYKNIDYQRKKIVNKIKSNKLLMIKFGRYIPRIESSFLLLKSISNTAGVDLKERWLSLIKAIYIAPDLFFEKRVYATIYNLLKISLKINR